MTFVEVQGERWEERPASGSRSVAVCLSRLPFAIYRLSCIPYHPSEFPATGQEAAAFATCLAYVMQDKEAVCES